MSLAKTITQGCVVPLLLWTTAEVAGAAKAVELSAGTAKHASRPKVVPPFSGRARAQDVMRRIRRVSDGTLLRELGNVIETRVSIAEPHQRFLQEMQERPARLRQLEGADRGEEGVVMRRSKRMPISQQRVDRYRDKHVVPLAHIAELDGYIAAMFAELMRRASAEPVGEGPITGAARRGAEKAKRIVEEKKARGERVSSIRDLGEIACDSIGASDETRKIIGSMFGKRKKNADLFETNLSAEEKKKRRQQINKANKKKKKKRK